jgi:hypothetical protein
MNDIDVILADIPGLGRVRLCACNSIHLSLGPVTLTLEPRAFAQMAVLIRNGVEQLAAVLASADKAADRPGPLDAGVSHFTH